MIIIDPESNEYRVSVFQTKIEDYYFSCILKFSHIILDKKILAEWPYFKFNIFILYNQIVGINAFDNEKLRLICDKLIDIKIIYCYLDTTTYLFYRGPTIIVGLGQIEKLNPYTISLLREIHYKVYLISVLTENILDFFQLILFHRITDYKKNKWNRIIDEIQNQTGETIITNQSRNLLIEFHDFYRSGELHKFSSVRGFTSRDRWNHFDNEIKVLKELIVNISSCVHRLT